MSELVAAIDLGTNTARLLIGTCERGRILPHVVVRRITRLGGGFSRETGISPEARERTLTALAEFSRELRQHDVLQIRAVATSAVRDAANGAEFCRQVREITGITLEVIDGHSEGQLTLQGVLAGLDPIPQHIAVFDVGGGSTEYTIARDRELLFSRSLPIGVVRLTEGKSTTDAMNDKIERELRSLNEALIHEGMLPLAEGARVVGTAGTATTLAAISMGMLDYDYRRVNNYAIQRDEIEAILHRLLPLSPAERLQIPGMEPGREDLIIAGTLVTLKSLELFGSQTLTVSDFGLLEGVLLSAWEKYRP